MVVSDGLERALCPTWRTQVQRTADCAAVRAHGLAMAVAGALSGFLRNLKLGEWGLARWALHDSCPIDAQHP